MQLSIQVDLGQGPFIVTTNLWVQIQWERKFKTKLSELANGVGMEDIAYTERYENYLRWDVKFGVRINSAKKNISHQFFVDLQNVTNRTNEFVRRYNEVTDEVNEIRQIGFFPDVMYRIQF